MNDSHYIHHDDDGDERNERDHEGSDEDGEGDGAESRSLKMVRVSKTTVAPTSLLTDDLQNLFLCCREGNLTLLRWGKLTTCQFAREEDKPILTLAGTS